MNIRILTADLQYALSKAIKGIKPTKILPITSYFKLSTSGNTLYISTTTFDTSVVIEMPCQGDIEDIYLPANELHQLIKRTTSVNITISVDDTTITVKGNGKWNIEKVEDTFNSISAPSYDKEIKVPINELKSALKIANSTLSLDNSIRCLTGVALVNNYILSTDNVKASFQKVSVDFGKDLLLLPPLLSQFILNIVTDTRSKDITLNYNSTEKIFSIVNDDTTITAYELTDKESYPKLYELMKNPDGKFIEINKQDLLESAERVNVVLGSFDNNAVNFSIADNEIALVVPNKITETVKLDVKLPSINYKINIKELATVLTLLPASKISLNLGNNSYMLIQDGDINLLLCYLSRSDDNE